jgi:hypothetical protein
VLLAGKKKLDRNGSVRGQVLLWRDLLSNATRMKAVPEVDAAASLGVLL